ncbi:hypothetical protein BD560DRAFT_494486 [Blakeslea trispora]|nr:hypothetical protein BD560DRAFT_494486 [Blakeslea trispora]
MAYHLACSFSLLNDYFMMKPNESLKHAGFTSDLLEINLINDKMESRGKVISKSWEFYSKKDAIIVNIISVKRINSSYISTALWMIKGFSESIIFFESCWNTLTAITGPSPCAHVASVMVMRDLKIDIQSRS